MCNRGQRHGWRGGYGGTMSAIPPLVFTSLILVMAFAPMIAVLMWSLRPTPSLSEIIQDARR